MEELESGEGEVVRCQVPPPSLFLSTPPRYLASSLAHSLSAAAALDQDAAAAPRGGASGAGRAARGSPRPHKRLARPQGCVYVCVRACVCFCGPPLCRTPQTPAAPRPHCTAARSRVPFGGFTRVPFASLSATSLGQPGAESHPRAGGLCAASLRRSLRRFSSLLSTATLRRPAVCASDGKAQSRVAGREARRGRGGGDHLPQHRD